MKLSTKIFLPIILISALLILLAGCFGVPADESPGYTPGTITGVIASPCCPTTSAGAVPNPPPDWCCLTNIYISCEKDFSLQDNIEVILTYGEDEVATTTTNEKGEYTFTKVPPVKNYVITVFCPDDDKLLVKDVATEVVGGKIFDAEITDWVSTSLGLVVDYLVDNTTVLGPENIELEEVIEDKCAFIHFPAFLRLVIEVRRVGEECGDLYADDAVQDALCKAAEEVGRIVIPDLDLGCYVGFTSSPPPVKYTLTTIANPLEAGDVDGDGTYTSGIVVPVTASPAVGWTFTGWSGDLTGTTNPDNVTMNSNKSVTGNFTQNEYTLTVTKTATESSYDAVGNVIHYTISVENTGNVTLTNIVVTDPDADSISGSPIVSLAPLATADVSATHTITLADLDAGSFTNTATAVSNEGASDTDDETVERAIISPVDSTMTRDSGKLRIRLTLIDQFGNRIPGDTLELKDFDRGDGTGTVMFGAWEVWQGTVEQQRVITEINFDTVGALWDVEIFVDVLKANETLIVKYYGYDPNNPVILYYK